MMTQPDPEVRMISNDKLVYYFQTPENSANRKGKLVESYIRVLYVLRVSAANSKRVGKEPFPIFCGLAFAFSKSLLEMSRVSRESDPMDIGRNFNLL